ncbi:hypothetical protein JCM19240_2902 [Vibrio maritimus]|uniref:Uncharacterized protein n=1 Tax=Vibrio maritimus TaxID=990268 RepID=A0A090TC01_9VIBR|nr:hypothetical protein JCM19240_2902 [Vibrio maritimus]
MLKSWAFFRLWRSIELAGWVCCPPQDGANLTQTFTQTMSLSVSFIDRDT